MELSVAKKSRLYACVIIAIFNNRIDFQRKCTENYALLN